MPVAVAAVGYVPVASPLARVALSVIVAASAAVRPVAVAVSVGSFAPYVFVAFDAVTVAGAFVIVKVPATYVTV